MTAITGLRSQTGQYIAPEARKTLRNTYTLLALTLLPTIVGSFVGVTYPITLVGGIVMHLLLFVVVIFGMQALIIKNRHSITGVYLLLLFTALMGYFLGPILSIALSFSNGVELIGMAMGGTAATFLVLAGYATMTTRNFATPGIYKTLFIGMMMAFIMSLVGVFLQIPALSLAISAIWIPVCSAFIVFTINRIVRGGESNYILATLTIYIMLLNLFQSMLHLLMIFGGQRD